MFDIILINVFKYYTDSNGWWAFFDDVHKNWFYDSYARCNRVDEDEGWRDVVKNLWVVKYYTFLFTIWDTARPKRQRDRETQKSGDENKFTRNLNCMRKAFHCCYQIVDNRFFYLYFQSNLLLCKYSDKIGTSDISVSCPPASSSNTFQWLISDSRLASTEPAAPPPTIIKSYSWSTCLTLNGRFSGSKKS